MRLQMRWFRIVSGRLLPPQTYLRPYLKREMAKAVEWLTCAVTAGGLQPWPRKAQSITTLIKEDRMRGFGSVVVSRRFDWASRSGSRPGSAAHTGDKD